MAALLLHAGEPQRADWWLPALPFALWTTAPLLAPWLIARRRPGLARTAFRAFVLEAALALALYGHAFFVSASSTAALALVFVPPWQWLIVLVATGLALIGGRRRPG